MRFHFVNMRSLFLRGFRVQIRGEVDEEDCCRQTRMKLHPLDIVSPWYLQKQDPIGSPFLISHQVPSRVTHIAPNLALKVVFERCQSDCLVDLDFMRDCRQRDDHTLDRLDRVFQSDQRPQIVHREITS